MKCKSNKGVNDTKKVAFTLAEVLITLGIIGVVVALIMPTVINKTKDKQYKAARDKALSTIGNASKNIAVQGNMNDAQNAKDFVNNILRSQIAIAKTCENDELENCGIPAKYKSLDGYEISMPKRAKDVWAMPVGSRGEYKSYGFLTGDGYAYNLFYFPECIEKNLSLLTTGSFSVCVNAIYDMNGLRGPNQTGKDIGVVTVFYPNETVQAVAPMNEIVHLRNSDFEYPEAQRFCTEKGKRLPNFEEGVSIVFNQGLVGGVDYNGMWALSTDGPRVILPNGFAFNKFTKGSAHAECVE